MVQNVAMVTLPKAVGCQFKHLELVSLQEFLALLILVLRKAKLKQQMISFDEVVSQEKLNFIANKMNATYAGLTGSQICDKGLELSSVEEQITRTLVRIMQAEDELEYEEPYLEGLRHILSQPEFTSTDKALGIAQLFEERSVLRDMLPQVLTGEGLQVVIGAENRQDAMRECTVVLSRYGIPGEVSGAIGAVGPTRMQYDRTISTVRYMSSLMSELLSEVYG